MNSLKRYIPEGTRDLIFEECSRKTNVINTLRDFYIRSGFMEVASPTLEFYDVFHLDNLSIEQEKMYKLFDNKGRIMVLRLDMTTPIARIAATKLKGLGSPVRICYSGNVFRVNEEWGGKFSEITQSGVEVLGNEELASDLDIIVTAIKALLSIGLNDFEIEIGQAKFFKALVENINLDEESVEKLRSLTENKNFAGLREFIRDNESELGESVEALKSLPELFGGIEILDKARDLTCNKDALSAIKNIADIYEKLETIGLSKFVSIDLGMVQHIHYYSGITFRGYSSKVGSTILSGGRYDSLVSQFGEAIPATGFGINIDNVMIALSDEEINYKSKEGYLICYEDEYVNTAYNIADELRKRGFNAEINLLKDKKYSLDYCKNKKIDRMLTVINEKIINICEIDKGRSKDILITDFFDNLEV